LFYKLSALKVYR